MFFGAVEFNGDLSSWDVSAVTDMRVSSSLTGVLLLIQVCHYFMLTCLCLLPFLGHVFTGICI